VIFQGLLIGFRFLSFISLMLPEARKLNELADDPDPFPLRQARNGRKNEK